LNWVRGEKKKNKEIRKIKGKNKKKREKPTYISNFVKTGFL